jgi:hypothetical protein
MSNVVSSPIQTPKKVHKGHEKKVAEFIFRRCSPNFNVKLSDGTLLKRTDQPKFTFVINDKRIFKKIILSPTDFTVGKAFIDKRIDIEGDIFEVMVLEENLPSFQFSVTDKIFLLIWVFFCL